MLTIRPRGKNHARRYDVLSSGTVLSSHKSHLAAEHAIEVMEARAAQRGGWPLTARQRELLEALERKG